MTQERYWDGIRWIDAYRRGETSATSQTVASYGGANGANFGGLASTYVAPRNKKGTAVLVLGIISCTAALLGFSIFFTGGLWGIEVELFAVFLNFGGLICGIVGAVMGVDCSKKAKTKSSSAGLVLSIIGICAHAMLTVSCLACFVLYAFFVFPVTPHFY
jgi:hypothetical protein